MFKHFDKQDNLFCVICFTSLIIALLIRIVLIPILFKDLKCEDPNKIITHCTIQQPVNNGEIGNKYCIILCIEDTIMPGVFFFYIFLHIYYISVTNNNNKRRCIE